MMTASTDNPLAIDGRVTLQGAPGSPYTRKMLAVLRYRHIPYRFLGMGESNRLGWDTPKVPLMPTFYFPDENGQPTPHTDSTPLIRTLEAHYSERRVVPADPVLALLDRIIEDYADEWLTKAMFHYRWQYEPDIERSATTLPHWRNPAASDDVIAQAGKQFAQRQIGRLGVVGSNAVTGPIIEASYRRFVKILNRHLSGHRFILGARPASSDFAVFGQLTCLAQFDPTPMALTFESGGRIYAWVGQVEDLSGVSPSDSDWIDSESLPASINDWLIEIARTYVPVMLANEAALAAGQDTVQAEVDGQRWTQKPFPYQAKCLRWLREAYRALTPVDQRRFDRLIGETGIAPLFEDSPDRSD